MKFKQRINKQPGNRSFLDFQEDFEEFEKEFNEPIELIAPSATKMGVKKQVKKGEAGGIKFDSQWELAFYIYYTKIEPKPIQRNETEFLLYFDENGKQRKWYPDFRIGADLYEIKGWTQPKDKCKHDQHVNVKWFGQEEMKPILHEVYKKFPNWKDQYLFRN